MPWYWDERRGRRRRQRPSLRPALPLVGVAAVAGAVLALWSALGAVATLVVGGVGWWLLSARAELRGGPVEGPLPDHTVTPVQAVRIEGADNLGADLGSGGGSDSGGI